VDGVANVLSESYDRFGLHLVGLYHSIELCGEHGLDEERAIRENQPTLTKNTLWRATSFIMIFTKYSYLKRSPFWGWPAGLAIRFTSNTWTVGAGHSCPEYIIWMQFGVKLSGAAMVRSRGAPQSRPWLK
jgi:hypothetical protein